MITHDLMEAVRLADSVLVMASDPGRIAERIGIDTPALARDDAFVHRTTAELLQSQVVRACFGLEAAPQATVAGTRSGVVCT
jgi:NitT/TauT family transport system ATP-binding protein